MMILFVVMFFRFVRICDVERYYESNVVRRREYV